MTHPRGLWIGSPPNDRQLGEILGSIAGDIIGSVHEFSRNEDQKFPLFAERSCPTDDSLLTWAVAETILRGERDYKPRLVGMLGYYEKNCQHATQPDLEVIRKTHTYNETCQGCVPECLAIAVGTADYESAVRFAASIRGDTDTLVPSSVRSARPSGGCPSPSANIPWPSPPGATPGWSGRWPNSRPSSVDIEDYMAFWPVGLTVNKFSSNMRSLWKN